MPLSSRRVVWILIFALLFLGGIAVGFVYFSKYVSFRHPGESAAPAEKEVEEFSFVRVYYPSEDRLVMEERRVRRQVSQIAIAEEIVREFLKGPSGGAKSYVPAGARLLRVYLGSDGVLYADLSDEFRRNFQGDALTEFLLLKGLYETLISNVTGINDVKVIIEGKEIESIGGHLSVLHPLKGFVSEIR